jgi:hypothetical protein
MIGNGNIPWLPVPRTLPREPHRKNTPRNISPSPLAFLVLANAKPKFGNCQQRALRARDHRYQLHCSLSPTMITSSPPNSDNGARNGPPAVFAVRLLTRVDELHDIVRAQMAADKQCRGTLARIEQMVGDLGGHSGSRDAAECELERQHHGHKHDRRSDGAQRGESSDPAVAVGVTHGGPTPTPRLVQR